MIFNIFKSKPTLKEIIPNGFIDIHSHILPGIDDGPKNINQSLELINEMKKIGFSKIIGTPHTYQGLYNNTSDSIKKSFEIIESKISKDIEVCYASEYLIDLPLVKKIENNSILCLKDNFVLVELPFFNMPMNSYEIIFKIITNGYRPILAHPERYKYLFDDFNKFKKLKKVGCLFQLNIFSIVGYYGDDILNISKKLLREEMIDFIGSDIHNINNLKIFGKKIMIGETKKIDKVIERTIRYFD